VLLECSGSPEAIASGIRCVAPAGTVVLVGMGDPTVPIPVDVVQRNELWVTGTFRYAHAYPAAIALAASGAVELDGLVTAHFGLAETEQALRAVRQDPTALKVIVHPNGSKMG
jgi:L-iditol 2-dehydrogenase